MTTFNCVLDIIFLKSFSEYILLFPLAINEKYNDVPPGDKLAIFGENEQLQIAMNKGTANTLLGLKLHEIIRIEFR